MNRLCQVFFLLLIASLGFAQNSKKDPDEFLARKKRTFAMGLHIHNYGIGIDALYARQKWKKYDWLITASLASQKDHREIKINSHFGDKGKKYVYDKRNYCYVLAFTAGIERIILPRNHYNRISFRGGISGGPALAFLKPYLIEVLPLNGEDNPPIVQFDPNIYDYTKIIGAADYFTGFNKMKVVPGFRAKLHFTLNISGTNIFIRAIHTGLQADIYGRKLDIMTSYANHQFFFGGFLGFQLGSSW